MGPLRLKDLWLELCLRLWGSATTVVGIMLLFGWWYGGIKLGYMEETSPRVPNPSTGQVVPMHWKSVVVYMTPQDAELDKWTTIGGLVSIFVFLGLAAWQQKIKPK